MRQIAGMNWSPVVLENFRALQLIAVSRGKRFHFATRNTELQFTDCPIRRPRPFDIFPFFSLKE